MRDKVNYISPGTFERIIQYIPTLGIRKWKDDSIQMLFKIMYYSALRSNEAIRLKKENFNLEDREIYLGKTKTKKNDVAHIPHIFVQELKTWLIFQKSGRLFDGLTYPPLYLWCRRMGVALDIEAWQSNESIVGEAVVTHLMRKSVAKSMLNHEFGDKASSIPVISKHLRHAKPSMTVDHYLKASLDSVKEAW